MKKHLRLFLLLLAMPAIVSEQGCNCDPSFGDGNGNMTCMDQGGVECRTPETNELMCLPDTEPCLFVGNGFTCPEGALVANSTCTDVVCGDENNSACVPPPPMNPGLRGQFIDSVLTENGLHYSAYGLGSVYDGVNMGDLLVGHFDPATYRTSLATMEPPLTDPSPLDPSKRNLVSGWEIVDGLPAPGAGEQLWDPEGWRGGIVTPGPDRGAYSSIAAIGNDLYIAYEERATSEEPDARSLRVAYGKLGSNGEYTWQTSVVDDTAHGALYPSITIYNGVPTIAYGLRQPAANPGDQPLGWVRVATATSATPDPTTGAFTWVLSNLVETISTIGCTVNDGLCGAGATCVLDGTSGRGRCAVPAADPTLCGAGAGCASGTSCFHDNLFNEDFCSKAKTSGDLVDATGLFNNLVVDATAGGLALVYYDRSYGRVVTSNDMPVRCDTDNECGNQSSQQVCVHVVPNVNNSGYCVIPGGDIWGLRLNGAAPTPDTPTAWDNTTRVLIDGYARREPVASNNYDAGNSATLAIDANGVWHVGYVDGIYERLRYAQVQTNNTVNNREIIDDGYGGPNKPPGRPENGQQRTVGDNASIVVTTSGEVRVLYGDSDALVPCFAVRTGANAWTIAEVSTRPNSGLFTTQLLDPSENSWGAWMERTLPITDITEDSGETIVYCAGTSCPP